MVAKPLRIGVLASGRGTNLQAILDASKEGRIQSRVAVVVSDDPQAFALGRAEKSGVPNEGVPVDAKLKGPERKRKHEDQIGKVLTHYKVDLLVLAGFMRILSGDFIRAHAFRIVNIHPALLPAFPGLHGQRQAVEWGARIAGCTTHFVDEETDHGPIILQAALAVKRDDTEATLAKRILEVEHQILPRTIHLIEEDRVRIEGRRVLINPDTSWTKRYPTVPGVLYGDGY